VSVKERLGKKGVERRPTEKREEKHTREVEV
jgi:hypothetical protein